MVGRKLSINWSQNYWHSGRIGYVNVTGQWGNTGNRRGRFVNLTGQGNNNGGDRCVNMIDHRSDNGGPTVIVKGHWDNNGGVRLLNEAGHWSSGGISCLNKMGYWSSGGIRCLNKMGRWNSGGSRRLNVTGDRRPGGGKYVTTGHWSMEHLYKPKTFLPVINTNVCTPVCAFHFQNVQQLHSTPNDFRVTFKNIFSEDNKKRVQQQLLSVEPLRTSKHIKVVDAPSQAAVLIPLCYINGKPSVLFTLRTSSLRKHRGEVSFPGGNMDETDHDFAQAALRETWEEIGLDMKTIDIWGALSAAPISRDGTKTVTPVIGFCGEIDVNSLKLSEDEVEEVFTRSIESLCDLKHVGSTQFRTGRGYTLPVFHGGPHIIWGITALFLHMALTLLAPGLYDFKVRHQS